MNRLFGNARPRTFNRVARAASDVGHVDAPLEAVAEPGHESSVPSSSVASTVSFVISPSWRWNVGKARVRHAAAFAEAPHHVLLDGAEHADELRQRRQVVDAGGAGQDRRVLRRERVRARRRVVASRCHRSSAHPAPRGRNAPAAPPRSAISSLVDGASSAIVSNSPVWCPMLIDSASRRVVDDADHAAGELLEAC